MDFIQTRYGDKGYAFVNVLPKMYNLPTDDKQTVHIMFDIQKGNQVTIGQIPIYGNDRTRDKVIRRELRIFEGQLYNETNKKLSEVNLNRLQFFENVKITPRTHRNRDDMIDLEVRVQERENVGILEGGIGYDGFDKFRLTGKVQNLNLFGLGHTIKVETQLNLRVQHITLDYDVPYFLDSDWHVGGEFYFYRIAEERSLFWNRDRRITDNCKTHIQYETSSSSESQRMKNTARNLCKSTFIDFIRRRGYNEQNISGGFTVGRKLNDWLSLYLTYRLQHLYFYNSIDKSIYPVDEINGLRNPLELIAEFDIRDDKLFPKSGVFSRTSFTYDGVLTKFNYFRFSENMRWYKRLFREVLFRVNFQYSRLFSFSGLSNDIPFDTWFRLGGMESLRGFEYYSVGYRKKSDIAIADLKKYHLYNSLSSEERDLLSTFAIGGLNEMFVQVEITSPVWPGQDKLLGLVFLDIGNAFNSLRDFARFKANWGAGIRFFTPLGPMRLEFGFPIRGLDFPESPPVKTNFTIGFPF